MSKRLVCRYCGNERKEGIEWYDDEYCSGKCKKSDGGEIPAAAVAAKNSGTKATLDHYKAKPKMYRRRYKPERLNWGEALTAPQLEQAGLRANREPIPGDWDYEAGGMVAVIADSNATASVTVTKKPNEWILLLAKAKELGISVHGKKKAQIEAEIKEKTNE